MTLSTTNPPRPPLLSAVEARVLGTLMEKARTVPDSYPLTLNTLLLGCNQKTSREPLMELDEAQVATALDALKPLGLVREVSGGRTARYEHNFQRAIGVPEQSAVLLGLLMLRGPQTAGELRLNTERWYKFADISSVEGFLEELQDRPPGKGRPPGRQAGPGARHAGAALGASAVRPGRCGHGCVPRVSATVRRPARRNASSNSRRRSRSYVPPSKNCAWNWACRHLDSRKRTTVLKQRQLFQRRA